MVTTVKKCLSVVTMMSCLAAVSFAAGPGTESAVFMKLAAGARAVAMGEAFCAVADDVNAVRYNPAGIAQLARPELEVSHNEWIEGIKSEFAGFVYPLNEKTAVGITAQYSQVGDLVRRDEFGVEAGGTFGQQGIVATVSGARDIDERLSIGANAKVIYESLDDLNDTGYAMDFGILYCLEKISFGAMAGNFGQGIKLGSERFNLPSVAAAGVAYAPVSDLTLSMDVDRWIETEKTEARIGTEYRLKEIMALRAGYTSGRDENTGPGITAGVGFNYKGYRLDYAFLPMGDLGNTHRVSFALSF